MLHLAKMMSPASISLCTMAAFFDALLFTKATAPAHVVMPSSEDVMKQSYGILVSSVPI